MQSLFLIALVFISLLSIVSTLPIGDLPIILIAVTLFISFFFVLFHRSRYFALKETDSKVVLENASWLKTIALLARILITVVFVIGAMTAIFYAVFSVIILATQPEPGTADIGSAIARAFARAFAVVLIPIAAGLAYLGTLFLPFWAALPIAAAVGRKWKNPGRFLLLRPFNRSYATKQLRIIARKRLAFFGHIYTLADKSIKVPWNVRIPIFIGQLGFLQFRMRKIKSKSQLSKLYENMENRWKRNFNWCVSWSKVFPVSTVDELWKDCFVQMAKICDVIFIDLSEMRESILWEIEQCGRMGISDRLIFLTHKDNFVAAKKYVQQNFRTGSTQRLFQYGSIGILADSDFESTIADMMTYKEP